MGDMRLQVLAFEETLLGRIEEDDEKEKRRDAISLCFFYSLSLSLSRFWFLLLLLLSLSRFWCFLNFGENEKCVSRISGIERVGPFNRLPPLTPFLCSLLSTHVEYIDLFMDGV